MKVLALTAVSGPYVVARYTALVNTFKDIDFTLIEVGKTSAIYAWEYVSAPYKRTTLSDQIAEQQFLPTLAYRLVSSLNKVNPEAVVIVGYSDLAMLIALLWCNMRRRPAVLLSETKEDDAPRCWWIELVKSFLLKGYRAAVVGGQIHKKYLMKLGMPSDAIFLGYDVVGNDDFHPDYIRSLPKPIDRPFFLSINRFIPKKNLFRLLEAYAIYCQNLGDEAWQLVLCGDGPLRSQIEQKIKKLNLGQSVYLPGFLQQDEMLPYFANAKCFIHASTQEQWGLVVNEAMAAGLPVLVSNSCGCFNDLIIEGVNGFGFDPEDVQQLAKLMQQASTSMDLELMGEISLKHIQNYSPTCFAQNLVQAIHYAISEH